MANLEAGTSSGGAPGDAGIHVLRDEDEFRVGDVIDGELLRAIYDSILYIPMFSPTCAASKWCLRELAKIVEKTDASDKPKGIEKKILFFDVEPDDVKAWSKALVEVDEIKGWNLEKDDCQGQLIKLVVEEVVDKLKIKHKPVTEHLVALTGQVEEVMKLQEIDVQLIRIHGMGGIGKITVAKVIFNQLCSHFGKRCSFLEDIREKSTKDGLVELQKKLLLDIVNSKATGRILDVNYVKRMTREIAYEYTRVLECP